MPDQAAQLRALLRTSFRLQAEGARYSKLSFAQGAADGYMKALLDSGAIGKHDLLRLVGEERARMNGPAIGALSPEPV